MEDYILKMVNITLLVNEITFTFQNGDVSSCKGAPSSELDNSMISGMGPMGAWNYDYNGSGKSINISGVLTPSDTTRTSTGIVNTILAQKQWLESLINGQQKPITITSKYESNSVNTTSGATSPQQADFESTDCVVNSISFEEEAGNPHQLPFNMTMAVGEGIVVTTTSFLLLEDGYYILQENGDKIII